MAAEPHPHLELVEYLDFEGQSDDKHEFWDGQIFAMAGGSPRHNAICFNIATAVGPQLRSQGCRGFSSDQRVRIPDYNLYVYPDLTIVCGEPTFDEADVHALTNPTLIVEVLSPTTQERDRGSKLFGYRSLPSLRGYLIVAQDRPWVEHWSKQADGRWLVTEIDDPEQALDLPEIEGRLPLGAIYADVDFG